MEQSQQDKHPVNNVSGTKDLFSFKDQVAARKYFYLTHTKNEVLIDVMYN